MKLTEIVNIKSNKILTDDALRSMSRSTDELRLDVVYF